MKTTKSKIQWTDYTFNPWRGCTKVSEGCANCYAERESKRNPKVLGEWGPGKPRVLASDDMWRSPLKWNKEAARFVQCSACGKREVRKTDGIGLTGCTTPDCNALPETESSRTRPRVFCASLADWLDNEVPIEWLVNLLETIHATPRLDWQLLTKRPELWQSRLEAAHSFAWHHGRTDRHDAVMDWLGAWAHAHVPPDNVWIGTSVENQVRANERIPQLLKIPAKVRFLSCEPLLGKVNVAQVVNDSCPHDRVCAADNPNPPPCNCGRIDWIIAGGESGPGARPMHPDWARSLRDQCQAAGVPFLFKQWGCWLPQSHAQYANDLGDQRKLQGHRFDDGTLMLRMAKETAGRVLDGRTHDEFPLSHYLIEMELTLVQNADLRACYTYYSQLLDRNREDIDEEVQRLMQQRKHLVTAMINRYDITSGLAPDDEDGKPMSPAKLDALLRAMRAMRGLRGSRWEKPAGNLGTGVLALPGGAQAV